MNTGQENLKKSLQKIRLEQFKANSKLNSYPIKTKPKTTLIIPLAINLTNQTTNKAKPLATPCIPLKALPYRSIHYL